MYPKLFQLGPVTIHTYGLLLATAYLVAIGLLARLGEKAGMRREQAWDLGLVVIVSAILGAKLLMILTDLHAYLAQPSRLISVEFLQAGGVFYGGLLGAILGSALYLSRQPQLQFLNVADVAAPAIAVGQTIGRLGCFSAGCDYGTPSNLPWAVTFTSEYSHRYVGVPINIPLHPTQLYESALTFLIFLFLLWALRHRRFFGQVFCLYSLLYGIGRFFLEFLRGDMDRGFVFGGLFSTSQFISLIIVPCALALYLFGRKKAAEPQSA